LDFHALRKFKTRAGGILTLAVVTFLLTYIALKVRDMLYQNNGELVTITTYFDDGNAKNPIFSKILK
jgi:hypothetical protein